MSSHVVPQIAVENLSFAYKTTEKKVLQDVSLQLFGGEFVLLAGEGGSGKTTLLRHLKPQLAPFGEREGGVFWHGEQIERVEQSETVAKIGYVFQNPENQIVTDKVWHELAFGAENLGLPPEIIRRRVAETASYFGIERWLGRDTARLSGGEKQILALASAMVLYPEVLILDEPLAQLDPIAVQRFLDEVARLNRDFGITIILSEHRLSEVLPYADTVLLMKDGALSQKLPPREAAEVIYKHYPRISDALPFAAKCFFGAGGKGDVPLTIREGREWLRTRNSADHADHADHADCGDRGDSNSCVNNPVSQSKKQNALVVKHIAFRYQKNSPDILRDVSLTLGAGEIMAILGGNGTGKTSLLRVISGNERAYYGKCKVNGRMRMIPQDPTAFFSKMTVGELLSDPVKRERAERFFDITAYQDTSPYDLSGGERQRLALAMLFAEEADIFLLDEPSKGLDAEGRAELSRTLIQLKAAGKAILLVSHDIEFAAGVADYCGMMFDGEIVSLLDTTEFVRTNVYYTTAEEKLFRD